jgi:hypothetical protein
MDKPVLTMTGSPARYGLHGLRDTARGRTSRPCGRPSHPRNFGYYSCAESLFGPLNTPVSANLRFVRRRAVLMGSRCSTTLCIDSRTRESVGERHSFGIMTYNHQRGKGLYVPKSQGDLLVRLYSRLECRATSPKATQLGTSPSVPFGPFARMPLSHELYGQATTNR